MFFQFGSSLASLAVDSNADEGRQICFTIAYHQKTVNKYAYTTMELRVLEVSINCINSESKECTCI